MTEAEQARHEWIEERIAIMMESGMEEQHAMSLARKLWERWDQDMARRATETAQERSES